MELPASGRCQCGRVIFELTEQPLFSYACHCHDCQKRTGSAFSMGLVVSPEAIALEGERVAWERVSDTGLRNTRHTCAACQNVIYGEGEGTGPLLKLQAGLLDDTRALRPDVHLFTRSAQAWVQIPEGSLCYDSQPDSPELLLQAISGGGA